MPLQASHKNLFSLVTHPHAKSSVWIHFGFKAKKETVSNWKKVFCHTCDKEIAYSGNTYNLSYHLNKFYSELRLWDNVNYKYTSNVSLKNFQSIQHVITYLDINKFLQYIYLLENQR